VSRPEDVARDLEDRATKMTMTSKKGMIRLAMCVCLSAARSVCLLDSLSVCLAGLVKKRPARLHLGSGERIIVANDHDDLSVRRRCVL